MDLGLLYMISLHDYIMNLECPIERKMLLEKIPFSVSRDFRFIFSANDFMGGIFK